MGIGIGIGKANNTCIGIGIGIGILIKVLYLYRQYNFCVSSKALCISQNRPEGSLCHVFAHKALQRPPMAP